MQRPRIKPTHSPLRLTPTLINIGGAQHGVGAELTDDAEGSVWRLLQLLDGTRDHSTIVDVMTSEFGNVDPDSIRTAIEDLTDAGFIEDAAAGAPATLSDEEVARYARAATYFGWIDTTPREGRYELQARLKAKRVTVCGLGGSGSAVAASLVAAGIGGLHCVDFDVVDESNLTRQLLYSENDIGRPKVDVAVDRLRWMNRFVAVTGSDAQITCADDVAKLMSETDLFVLCADTPRGLIQRWVNEAAYQTRTPWQMALYAGPMVVTGLFVPGATRGCYGCIPQPDLVYERRHGVTPEPMSVAGPPQAALAPTANVTGHVAALEAIYFLAGLDPISLGRVFHLSLADLTHHYFIDTPPEGTVGCAVCGSRGAD